jgi:hypothetical protein
LDSKRIAALAGVLYYLQAERDKQRYLEERFVKPYSMVNRWSMYGRRTIMQLRNRAQRRILDNHLALPFVKEGVSYRCHCPLRVKNLVVSHDRLLTQGRVRRSRRESLKR